MHKYRANYPDNESVGEKRYPHFFDDRKNRPDFSFYWQKNECKHSENSVKSGENSKNGEKR
jgi:hypothetical protein